MDGSDVNAVDRSPSGKLLAVADDFGKVSIYRYPCLQPGTEACVYTGHSSHGKCKGGGGDLVVRSDRAIYLCIMMYTIHTSYTVI